jgi:hypothetical protein
MQHNILASLAGLAEVELVAQVKVLIEREHDVTAEIVAHLAELDTRDVHLRAGYPSLYLYCRDALGLSEWEAYNRIEVARAARRFPVILQLLAEGAVTLTAVKLLAPHLTSDNYREVLETARGKRKADVEQLVARLSPKPDVACSVRRLPAPPAVAAFAAPELPSPPGPSIPLSDAGETPALAPLAAAPPEASFHETAPIPAAAVRPLSPDRYRFQVTIGAQTLEKIRLAKDLLGHAIPSGDDAAILDRAFTALLTELAKKKFADAPKPRGPRRPAAGGRSAAGAAGTTTRNRPSAIMKPPRRSPAAAVKRAVWLRDLGRCAFIGTDGHRCNERRFVEFHHVDPHALGGEATVDGIQLRCRRHNDYEGRLYFGKGRRVASDRKLVPEQARLSVTGSTSERPVLPHAPNPESIL